MHIYFKKGSHFARRKNDIVVNRAKTTTFGKKRLRTLGPKIWNSLPEDVKEFIKTCYGPECKRNICKTRVTHITILELHTLAWICPSGNLIPNINKRNIKRNETIVF